MSKKHKNKQVEVKKEESTDVSGIVFVVMVILACGFLGFLFFGNKNGNNAQAATQNTTATVNTDGKQIIEMSAGFSGYAPSVITAKAGTPTVLRVKSSNNFGCGSSFRISKLGIAKNLPANGTTDIDLGTQSAGTVLNATCAMGMYRANIEFK